MSNTSKKRPAKSRIPGDRSRPDQPEPGRFSRRKLGLASGVVVLGIAFYVGLTGNGELPLSHTPRGAETSTAATRSAASPESAVTALPPAPPGTKSPINSVDPVTGKLITPASPSVLYKGYTVAFCCKDSAGYKGGWERMSEADKNAFVRSWLK